MAVTAPIMALGLDVPNPTFSIPGKTSGLAGGWTKTANIVVAGYYTGGPSPGHARYQYCSVTGEHIDEYLRSAPCPPGQLSANVSVAMQAWLLIRTSGLGSAAGDSKIRVYLQWYDSSNVLQGTGEFVSGGNPIQTNYSSWTLWKGTGSYTPPATAAYARVSIRPQRTATGSDLNFSIAFAGVGTYDGTSREYVFTSYGKHPGTFAVLHLPRQKVGPTSLLAARFLDRDRFPQPYRAEIQCSGVSDSMKAALEYLYGMNAGRAYDGATTNPGGGYWPIILESGNAALPTVGLYDFADDDFPLRPAAEIDWLDLSAPVHSGSLSLLERL